MVWGVEARQAGRLAVRQAHVVVERLVGHSVMPHNIDLQPVSEPHTPPSPSPLSSFYSYATQRLRERARESECEQVWCEVWRVGDGDRRVLVTVTVMWMLQQQQQRCL